MPLMSSYLEQKQINLALQGGGSHGAYTWGVLDRLLQEGDRLRFEGVSGTSAGALNAAALAQGLSEGGAQGAQKLLEKLWRGVSEVGAFTVPQSSPFADLLSVWGIPSPMTAMADMMQRVWSPYQTNPLNINPLRCLVDSMLDIESIRACKKTKLFISATDVETGRAKVFGEGEVTVDALMASACLPFLFQAVEINKKPYWDGGYVGNPSIFPLIYHCVSPDILLVQINPLIRPGTPDTSAEIIDRLNEITFNASLISEMRAIAFVQKLIDDDQLKGSEEHRLKRINMHVVSAEDALRPLGAASKSNMQMDFLFKLRDIGRIAADEWLKINWGKIGVESSADIRKMFL